MSLIRGHRLRAARLLAVAALAAFAHFAADAAPRLEPLAGTELDEAQRSLVRDFTGIGKAEAG